jgi:hypothetical protein
MQPKTSGSHSFGRRLRLSWVAVVAVAALILAGTAASAPSGGLSAQPLAFGNVTIGSSKTLSLTITNVGTQTIAPGGIVGTFRGGPDLNAWSAVFVSTICPPAPAGLAPGQSCSVDVTFTPNRKGGHKSHLVLIDGLGDSLAVPVSGTGA